MITVMHVPGLQAVSFLCERACTHIKQASLKRQCKAHASMHMLMLHMFTYASMV